MGRERTRYASIALACLVGGTLLVAALAAPAVAQDGEIGEKLEIRVAEDGDIEHIDWRYEMDAATYEAFAENADESGYESVAVAIADGNVEEGMADEYTDASDTERSDGYTVEYRLLDINTDDGLEATESDGSVAFRMTGVQGVDDELDELTVTVDMPGEISESNADETDGSAATWNLHEEPTEELTAETATADGTGGSDDGDSDDSDSDNENDGSGDDGTGDGDDGAADGSDDGNGDDAGTGDDRDDDDGSTGAETDGSNDETSDSAADTDAPDDDGNAVELTGFGSVLVVGTVLVAGLWRLRPWA